MPHVKVGIVSQARMTSSRLPGKVLLKAGGKTLLDHHLARLRLAGVPVYLATTDLPSDDPLASWAEANGISYVRGSETDVLSRFGLAAAKFGLDVIVRVTSDCPLIDGQLIADGIRQYLEAMDAGLYLTNGLQRTFPRGMDFEIFSRALLDKALDEAQEPHEREHVTPYFYQRPKPFVRIRHLTQDRDDSDLRLTVDEADDYALVRALIQQHGAADLSARQLADLLYAHPEMAGINASVGQKTL